MDVERDDEAEPQGGWEWVKTQEEKRKKEREEVCVNQEGSNSLSLNSGLRSACCESVPHLTLPRIVLLVIKCGSCLKALSISQGKLDVRAYAGLETNFLAH